MTSHLSYISHSCALSFAAKSRARISTPLIISRSNSASRIGSNTNSAGDADCTLCENEVTHTGSTGGVG